jgi:SAM-dependent methyltransferase
MAVLDDIRRYWAQDAAIYDHASDHTARTGAERAAWTAALASALPAAPARVLDCGAGTGFLSLMAARLGHHVTAVDLSAEMLVKLEASAAVGGLVVETVHGSATDPPAGEFDAVMERHLLWTLPDPAAALRAWRRAAPAGRLVLVESMWGSVDPVEMWRSRARKLVRRWLGRAHSHHSDYTQEMVSALPLGAGAHPSTLVDMAEAAGWPAARLERLPTVEWASLLAMHPLERALGVSPRFIVSAGG